MYLFSSNINPNHIVASHFQQFNQDIQQFSQFSPLLTTSCSGESQLPAVLKYRLKYWLRILHCQQGELQCGLVQLLEPFRANFTVQGLYSTQKLPGDFVLRREEDSLSTDLQYRTVELMAALQSVWILTPILTMITVLYSYHNI